MNRRKPVDIKKLNHDVEEVGLRKNFYRDPVEDALILTCDKINI